MLEVRTIIFTRAMEHNELFEDASKGMIEFIVAKIDSISYRPEDVLIS